MPRLKSEIWIAAHLRICQQNGAFGVVVRRGDDDAGAIAIKIFRGHGQARLILQSTNLEGEKIWRDVYPDKHDEALVDERLYKEISMDPDLWILEIEGCDGSGYLEVAQADGL